MATPGRTPSQDLSFSPRVSSGLAQYPFPNQDPGPRRVALRRGSTSSSVSSTPTITESGPNAISTLLQPPIIRTGLRPTDAGFKPPTQKDIPPVALTNVPHVEPKTFQPYLSQVGSLYEAFQRAKAESEAGDTALFHREKREKEEDWDAILSKRLQRPAHSRLGSSASVTSPVEPPSPSRRRSSNSRRTALTPLSTIPSVYGEDDFHLENPRTFDIVSEHSEIVRDLNAAPTGRKSLASNAILQEKLSWYMDTVEVHLISSISTASKSFFSALGSLQDLHDEARDSVTRIQKLRRELAKLDKEMAMDGLKVVNLKQRRNNVRKLAEAILQLEDIVQAVQECEEMVEEGNIDDVVDSLDDIERLIAGRETNKLLQNRPPGRYCPADLRQINALGSALDDLKQLRSKAGRGYENRFHNCLLNDMRQHVQRTDPKDTLQRWGSTFNRPKPGQRRPQSTFPSYMNMSPDFRIELEQAMHGLARARHTTPAVTTFRAAILREMKSTIRKQLPSSNDDDTMSTISASTSGRGKSQHEKSSILARNLRALDGEDWSQMLVKVYTNVSESLRRLSVQVKILLDVTSTMDQTHMEKMKSPPTTPDPGSHMRAPSISRNRAKSLQAEMQQALDLSSLLGEAVDHVQNQVTKVIRVRSQQNSELSLSEFIRYVTLNRLFAEECEAISGRSGQGLRQAVDTQIRDYVSQYGEAKRQLLVEIMDRDDWKAQDFGNAENAVLARVIEGSTNDAQSWLAGMQIWTELPLPDESSSKTVNGESAESKEKTRSAVVDEQKFILPQCPIAMLRTIDGFQQLAVGVPGMSQEIASMLLDCLRQFNSRTLQLILGAGATRTAGLKNITTKHLALSSQGLSFIIALMPYIREFFRRYLPVNSAGPVFGQFDQVKRSFQEHQQSIHEKLVDILSARAAAHLKTMKAIAWEEAAENDKTPSKYMDTWTKETATLYKVLSQHLPQESVSGIMVPIFDSYKQQWEEALQQIKLTSPGGKRRLMVDADYFNAKISKLEGAADLGQHFKDKVQALSVDARSEHSQTTDGVTPSDSTSNVQ